MQIVVFLGSLLILIGALWYSFYDLPSLIKKTKKVTVLPKDAFPKEDPAKLAMLGLAAQIEKDLFFGTGKVSHSTDFPTLVKIKPIKLKKTKMTERKSKKKSKKKK